MEVGGELHVPADLSSRKALADTRKIGVVSRVVLNTLDRRKARSPFRESNDDSSDVRSLYSLSYPGSIIPNGNRVKVKFTLEQASKVQWGSRCIAILFLGPRH
jgi:hypothetical protein